MTLALPVAQMIDALPLPALAIDGAEQIIALNEAAQKLLGLPARGRHYITVLRQPAVVEAVEACLVGRGSASGQFLARENGHDVTYLVNANRVGDEGVALLTFQDTTFVMAADQMRRDFVANVSHELRTPLTALTGFIETLRGPARDDAVARDRFLSIMSDETDRMNRLVGDLLSLSRVEAAERVRPTQEVDVVAVLAGTLRNLRPLASEVTVELVSDLPDNSILLRADADQLTQVFTNVIENAIKYGGMGKRVFVSLHQEVEIRALRRAGVIVGIRDEGQGIDARHLPRLTERFYRADDHRNRDLGGTGLGLAIVKHILNRHGGRLKVTSKVGEGTEFKILLPLE